MDLFSKCLRLNLSTTATLGIDESGHCREVAVVVSKVSYKQESMYVLSSKKSGRCGEVAVSRGVTVLLK